MLTSVSCNVISIYTQHASVYNSVITNTHHFTVISSHHHSFWHVTLQIFVCLGVSMIEDWEPGIRGQKSIITIYTVNISPQLCAFIIMGNWVKVIQIIARFWYWYWHGIIIGTNPPSTLHMLPNQWILCFSTQLLKWPSPPWPWQAEQPPLWVSPGQLATPSATPSLCPTPPKMAPSMSPNLPTVTPPTLWPPSNLAPLTGLRWRLWGRETEQTDRGKRSLGTLLQMKVIARIYK